MGIKEIRNTPAYHISYNPAFLIIRQGDDYMFYNSINHKAFRLNNLEFELLNLLYTYDNKDYVLSLFEGNVRKEVERIANTINELGILDLECEQISESGDTNNNDIPSTYYIHLTDECNLNCSYCYNKEWRKNGGKTLSYDEWEMIISKIMPFARTIVFTGGEFFLVSFAHLLLKYIKERNPQIIIEGLSNGCLDYSKDYTQEALTYIDKITLSCDSLNDCDERAGFNKRQFLDNVSLLTKHFPKTKIAIATTMTAKNHMSVDEIKNLCDKYGLEWKKTAVCPSSPKDTSLMVELDKQVEDIKDMRQHMPQTNHWISKQIRCGAAKTVCSIDAKGNVYPCQTLHYEPFCMGNLLKLEIKELKYIADSSNVMPGVDELMPCKICKVKYICGGGCFANRHAYNKTGRYASLFCPTRYENSLSMLLSLNNRVQHKQ